MPLAKSTPLLLLVIAPALTVAACTTAEEIVYSDEPLFLNELMAKNADAVVDEYDENDDWFEIYNGGDEDVDLAGYLVGDKASKRCRAQIGEGVTLPAGGVVVLWADGTPEQGPNHLPFKLSAGGEELYLSDASCAQIDVITFSEMVEGEVLARYPDGEGEPTRCLRATPNELNGSSCE